MAETKVILTKSVNHLGHPGDVVSVKAGYARNYLIPQGLGFAWSKNAAAQIEAMKRARLAKAVAPHARVTPAKTPELLRIGIEIDGKRLDFRLKTATHFLFGLFHTSIIVWRIGLHRLDADHIRACQ